MRVLQFSGGKDSLALLYHMQPEWDDLLVMWCNAGAAYDSTRELMDGIRALVPHFMEVKGDQPGFVSSYGYPADVVPVGLTRLGRLVEGTQGDVFVPAYDCCHANIWTPLAMACKALGVTEIYRGQKACDGRKAPIRDGFVENGVAYRFPLFHWSDADVVAYLGARLPDHYRAGERTSRDCWSCTAYLDDNAERIAALPTEKRVFLQGKLDTLLARLHVEQAIIERCVEQGA